MSAKFEVFKDQHNKYRFHLRAANGKVIAASEGYKNKADAVNGVESVRTNAADAAVIDLTAAGAKH